MKKFLNQTMGFGLILFIFLSVYNIYQDIRTDLKYIHNIENLQKQITHIDKNSQMVLELQRERGLTSIYLENTSQKHREKLLEQRESTSPVLLHSSQDLLSQIKDIRLNVDTKKVDKLQIFYSYSKAIRSLLLDTESLTFHTNNKIVKNELIIYNELNALQEILGQIRAKVGLVLSAGILNEDDIQEIKRRNLLFEHHLENTFTNDIIASRKYTKQISKTKCLKQALLLSQNIQEVFNSTGPKLSSLEWFALSTCAITKINSFVSEQREIIHKNIQEDIQKSTQKRTKNLVFWLFGTIVLIILLIISYKKSKRLLKEQALLKHYKLAIDYAAIVSKTDTDGNITYINDNFRTLSGYTDKELLGNNHNVLRHPDVPAKVFDNLWETITKGEKWNGLVQNRKKDGTSYWADSFIIPIYDESNALVEYIAIRNDVSDIIHLNNEIQETQREIIYRLGEAVESRSKESGNHIKRVSHYSKLLAQLSNMNEDECDVLFAASSMHDVGKIAIPDAILLKPASLNEEEWEIMKTHSFIGYNLFKDSKRPLLQAAAEISHEHHERYDGKGYPRGIKGEDICIFARIVAIADVFDALCSRRVYKEPWQMDDVLKLFNEESGKQFDPSLVKLLINNFDAFIEIWNRYK